MKRKVVSQINLREDRLPPGQRWISAPIVYDIVDDLPDWDLSKYRFKVWGEVKKTLELSYEEILSLPAVELVADFHCVTQWSVKDIVYASETTTVERQIPVVRCAEPVYSVMVMEFDCKANSCQEANHTVPNPLF